MKYRCESIHEKGQGVAIASDGKPLFVDDWLVGELAEIEIIHSSATYHVGKLERRLSLHPSRVEPPCPLFHRCGGCQLQHLSLQAQHEWKLQALQNQLAAAGLNPQLYPIDARQAKGYGYRHKLLLPFRRHRGRLECGFFSSSSNALVPIASLEEKSGAIRWTGCVVQAPALNELVSLALALVHELAIQVPLADSGRWDPRRPALRWLLARASYKFPQVHVTFGVSSQEGPWKQVWQELARRLQLALSQKGLELVGAAALENARGDNRYLEGEAFSLLGEPFLEEELLGLRFRYDPLSFFQVNPAVAECMWLQVRAWLQELKTQRLLELYSGRGLLANWLALEGFEVLGLERDVKAVKEAQALAGQLASRQALAACFQAVDLSQSLDLAKLIEGMASVEGTSWISSSVWMVNPPRKGLSVALLKMIGQNRPRALIYMACGQQALIEQARELKALGYQLKELRLYDMFSQTCHVETLALFAIS